jgi:putative flippase GtrA
LLGEPIPETARFARLRAVPAFAVVGFLGFLIDSGLTSLLAWLGLSLALARPPGVIVATVFNFMLNRRFTFQATHLPVGPAFLRYVAVTAAGLTVNYLTYLGAIAAAPHFGVPATPATAPIFVALGVGAAMFVTFEGFRRYAFRREAQ